MTRQIPLGPADLVCPLHRKSMAKVCHVCPWWTQIRGKNPQSNEEIDQWNCAVALAPMLTVEVAQQARQAGAATESFRNEMVKANHATLKAQHVLIDEIARAPKLITQ